ncbi:MAG: hypothetical protein SOV85_01890 [Clostridium sp.]|uniref:hypothetical protein n=1 Tax=Clostridium sp. TaxID=1506 RepID=UPI002A7546D7|nr:hypothetical protein [Clostridium sp.]MDY2630095.1 hypothetical protein [Clostridium sp.]
MLLLKVKINNFFGENHPQGVVKEEKYYKLDENMTVKELENYINRKVNSQLYIVQTFEIIKTKED